MSRSPAWEAADPNGDVMLVVVDLNGAWLTSAALISAWGIWPPKGDTMLVVVDLKLGWLTESADAAAADAAPASAWDL